ncbi:4242_t:CDS:2 [Racocetra fulgida]|uniref:4242_t:CDS:1 n=1 Tax=Racocetra fulgida TaxID=60492 RepID=A0A9N8YXW0_9GLOM|nr:4242_t:CDS:2 [Racocetra fulgida]
MGNITSITKKLNKHNTQAGADTDPSNLFGNGCSIRTNSNVRIIGGRPFLDENTSIYVCPTDWQEADRAQMGHYTLKHLLGGSYTASLSDILKPGSKVLVTQKFPDAEVHGVDIVSSFPTEIKPQNCYFKLCNVLEGLPFDSNEFDYVFMRHMLAALKKDQWDPLFREIMRVLKPGGVVESVEEMDFQFTSKLEQTIKNVGFQNVNGIRKIVPLGK